MISLAAIRWTILEVASCMLLPWGMGWSCDFPLSLIPYQCFTHPKTSPGSKLESCLESSHSENFSQTGKLSVWLRFADVARSPLGPGRFQVHQSVQHWMTRDYSIFARLARWRRRDGKPSTHQNADLGMDYEIGLRLCTWFNNYPIKCHKCI